MKVLIISKNLNPGGAERQLAYLAECINRNHSVEFLLFEEKGALLSYVKEKGIKIDTIDGNTSLWKLSRKLRTYIKQGHYTHVISFLPECNLLSEIAGLPYRNWKIITGARSADPTFVKNFKRRIYYHAHVLADAVISNSQKNKDDILKVNRLIKADKVKVLYNIFRLKEFDSTYVPFKKERINIVVAANYRPVKNLMGLLEALESSSQEVLEKLHIDWYGLKIDGTYKNAEQYITDNNLSHVIELHDSTDKVLAVYNQADAVGLFSHFEGLPNAICEALIIGKPVICTPVSDIPRILKGTKNIVCASSSKEDIKAALESLAGMSREEILKLGNDNKTHYTEFFDTDRIEKQFLSYL